MVLYRGVFIKTQMKFSCIAIGKNLKCMHTKCMFWKRQYFIIREKSCACMCRTGSGGVPPKTNEMNIEMKQNSCILNARELDLQVISSDQK